MPSPWDTFKVTALSIRHSEYKSERLVLYNVNVPVHLISNENVYNVIRDTIVHDFDNNSGIYFQLSAVYTLVNRDTGDLRTWTGSFNPRNRQPNQLTTHRRFEPDTFIDFAGPKRTAFGDPAAAPFYWTATKTTPTFYCNLPCQPTRNKEETHKCGPDCIMCNLLFHSFVNILHEINCIKWNENFIHFNHLCTCFFTRPPWAKAACSNILFWI